MLRRIWDWGKKVVITGVVVSSAPFVIPPLFLISTLGFMVSVPFGFAFMGYACTAKVFQLFPIRRPLFLARENDRHLRSMIQRFESGNDKKGQLEGLPEETGRETEKKDGSEEDLESVDDKLFQSVKWKAKVTEEEPEQVADGRVVEKGNREAFGERGTKQSETDENWKEEEVEMETKKEDRIKKEDIESPDEKVFQSAKRGDEAIEEIDQMADEREIEEGRESFEGPKESKAVDGRKEENKEPNKSEEKNVTHEVEMDVHISEKTLLVDHPLDHKSEPASSPGTAGYFAPPTLSSEDLTDATEAPSSSEYSSLVVEAPLGRNRFTECMDEGLIDEGEIWEEIDSLRMIIGCKTALQTSFVEELRALYLFTGIEPPSAFSPDLWDVNHKLRYLKSVVGIKKL